jgi:Superfamily II DNA and RNA helicases
MEPAVTHLTGKYLRTPVRVAIGATTCTADRVELRLYEVPGDRKLGLLHHLTRNEPGATLVFARTKHGAERLARKLERLGVRSAAIHGGRTQAQRNRALAEFRAGRHHVLVATDVAARGLHVDGVAHVVNYDLPQAPEDFIHRVARTGRAGHSGVATTFCTPAERQEVRRIERTLQASLIRIALPGDLPREAGAAAGIAGNTVVVLPVNRPAKVVFRSGRRRRA